jgi:xylulokinase
MLWREILADVLGTTVVTTSTAEGAAQGAALLAAVGIGWFPMVQDACAQFVETTDPIHPSGGAELYYEHFGRYRGLYGALASTFHALPTGDERRVS